MWLNMGLDPQFHRPELTGKKKARLSQNALEDHGSVWHTYEKHREETPFAVDQILEAVGLNKLPLYGSTGEIKSLSWQRRLYRWHTASQIWHGWDDWAVRQ